jgi:cysteine desulfurase/selenocysteine lyase
LAHEKELTAYGLEKIAPLEHLKIFGKDVANKGGVISFEMDIAHPHDVAQILDMQGVAVRAGHHCAMPLHEKFHIPATTRASFYIYNTKEDIDKLVEGLQIVIDMFG